MIRRLLQSSRTELTVLDLERDAAAISRWTQDPEFWSLYEKDIPRPLSISQVRKKFAVDPREENNLFRFGIWARDENRLVGWTALQWVDWIQGNAWIRLAVGAPQDRNRGYEEDALHLLLEFGFDELNLFRLQVRAFEYDFNFRVLLEKLGFVLEACQRQEVRRPDRRWDLMIYGILRSEWSTLSDSGVGKQ